MLTAATYSTRSSLYTIGPGTGPHTPYQGSRHHQMNSWKWGSAAGGDKDPGDGHEAAGAEQGDPRKFRERERSVSHPPWVLPTNMKSLPFHYAKPVACLPLSLPVCWLGQPPYSEVICALSSPPCHQVLAIPRIAQFLSELSRWKGLGRRDRGVR